MIPLIARSGTLYRIVRRVVHFPSLANSMSVEYCSSSFAAKLLRLLTE